MGRKGVSKRKTSKSKGPSDSGGNTNSVVSTIARVTESRAPQSLGRGEAISSGKGDKKSKQNGKKR
jgi:hypothetical protein